MFCDGNYLNLQNYGRIVKYNKLVRDKISEIIKQEGKTPIIRIADEEEYVLKLREKLHEEADEVAESHEVEELVDIMEVIYALAEQKGISYEELEKIRQRKANKKGRFAKRIILEEVDE